MSTTTRNSYHTSLKELVYHGLLPPKYKNRVPRTNIHRWRKDSFERYVGSEINSIADKHTDLIKTLNHYPRMFYAYGRLVKTLITIISCGESFNILIRNSKDKIINAILHTKEIIPIQKAIRIFNISKTTYHTWFVDVKYRCDNSYFNQCNKIYSRQVTPSEVSSVKKLLTARKYKHWSIKSIHLYGVKKGILTVSEKTMYKLNRLLGIRIFEKRKRLKKKNKKSIHADKPNTIWHADITTLRTLDGKRYYIYLIIDNFSRYILSYSIAERVSGLISTDTLKEAYLKAIEKTKNLNVDLIVDGGPENNNIHINNFISNSQVNIQKLVALRDIQHSNAMIEALNKTLKYYYLFPRSPRGLTHLKRILRYFIYDYCEVRPHGKLNGLTPKEAWIGMKIPEDFRIKILKQARKSRLEYNRTNKCGKCIG